jgi:uncharacterized protein DUF6789
MLERLRFWNPERVDAPAAAIAGVVAGIAFSGTMYVEIRLSGRKLNDLVLLGRPLTGSPDKAALAGFPIHELNAAALGVVYATYGRNRLPGPPALRGALFTLIENVVLYPLTYFEGIHPAVKDGQVDRYWSLHAHLWTVPRHVAYGLVLGSLYERLRNLTLHRGQAGWASRKRAPSDDVIE